MDVRVMGTNRGGKDELLTNHGSQVFAQTLPAPQNTRNSTVITHRAFAICIGQT
jgi:hypothetical protein